MEQLQHIKVAYRHGGGQLLGGEFAGVGLADQLVHVRNLRQKGGQNIRCHIHGTALKASLPVKFRQSRGNVQTPVGSQTLQDGFCAVSGEIGVSR